MNPKRKMLTSKRRLLMMCALLRLQALCMSQENFTYDISGIIPGSDKILLAADMYGSKILDSAENKDGKFSFRGKSSTVTFGTLIVEKKNKMFSDYHNLFIEPGKIKVQMYKNGLQAEVRGSKNNDIMSNVEAGNKEFWEKASPIYDSLNYASMKLSELHQADIVNNDSVKYYQDIHKRMGDAASPYVEARNKKLIAAFQKYPQTLFTAYYAINSGSLPDDTLKAMYTKFDEKIKNTDIGKQWNERLFKSQHLEPGAEAPEFSATDMAGKTINLSDYKGKYVVLDFWATWCMPCRAGNPHLIEVYKKYKDIGVEFIGIGDDDKNIAGWKKAIKNDGIDLWPQVLRGRDNENDKGESLDICKVYKIDSYPTKILIDKEGKVVANWIGDDELEKVLGEIFGKKR